MQSESMLRFHMCQPIFNAANTELLSSFFGLYNRRFVCFPISAIIVLLLQHFVTFLKFSVFFFSWFWRKKNLCKCVFNIYQCVAFLLYGLCCCSLLNLYRKRSFSKHVTAYIHNYVNKIRIIFFFKYVSVLLRSFHPYHRSTFFCAMNLLYIFLLDSTLGNNLW